MNQPNALDHFGEFLMVSMRDAAIDAFDGIAMEENKAPALQSLQSDLRTLSDSQIDLVRRAFITAIDSGLHDFLFSLHEQASVNARIQISVDGQDVVQLSDGIQGEMFTDDGWIARFSKFGEPSEDD
ncbi:MAG: hypothetical protein AAF591_19235 [Verrucomicrobiota bacterium]